MYKTDAENVTRTLRLAFLSPKIVEDILDGKHPLELTSHAIRRTQHFPLNWGEQVYALGLK